MTELTYNDVHPSGGGGRNKDTPGDVSVGVAAACDVPAQVSAGPYPGALHLSFGKNLEDDFKAEFSLKVKFKNGTIGLETESTNQHPQHNESTNQWLRYVQPARDRHEQNCEFYRHENGEIYLQTLKKLEAEEQLLAWYSEQLSRDIGIPFLGLHNILGNQQYVCDRCGRTYTHPNPLKVHLRTRCDKGSSSPSPVRCTMPERDVLFRPYLQCSCSSSIKSARRRCCDNIPAPGPSITRRESHPGHRIISAFRPIQQHATTPTRATVIGHQRRSLPSSDSYPVNLSMKDSHSKSKLPANYANQFPQPIQIFNHIQPHVFPFAMGPMTSPEYKCYDVWTPYGTVLSYHQNPSPWTSRRQMTGHGQQFVPNRQCKNRADQTPIKLPVPVPMPSESDGEPLDLLPKSYFANKSNKGHFCIYCGKLYSRKYGLKIHLRTHTGYKPLKCKVCLRPFGDPSNLNKHIRLHAQGETPYRCDFCGKVLVRRRDLERHVKSRHPNALGSDFVCKADGKLDTTQDVVVV